MKPFMSVLGIAVLLGLAAGAGYWFGAGKAAPAPVAQAERKVLFYRNPMGLPDTSPVPKKDAMGMDYVPVYADEQAAAPGATAKGKVLYYRNPMGLPDTSPVPKKDSMGMDYTPVYEGDEPQEGGVKISADRVQKLGVRTEAAAMRSLARTLRAVGTIQIDERTERTVAPRFEGWIQRLHVNATGQFVQRGQALMDVYSPDLVAAQQEYVVAIKGVAALKDAAPEMQANMRNLVEGSLQRLRNWDIDEQELARLKSEGKPSNTITLRSPVSGVVVDKPSVQGMRFMPGEKLYRIADLSSVWLLADIFEQDIGLVRAGQAVSIRVNAYPDKTFQGKVAFIYPTVTPETRTVKARIELRNTGMLLKPAMYASLELAGGDARKRLTVPDSAVLDSGTRQIVLVRRGEGLFAPREVRLGARGDGYVEVLEGVKEGEDIVVSANFLIDAESNLRAAIGGFGASASGTQTQPPVTAPVDAAKSAEATRSAGAIKPVEPTSATTSTNPTASINPAVAVKPAGAIKAHAAEGTVVNADPKAGVVSIAHGPVPSLKWDGMTMEFKVLDAALFAVLKNGEKVRFEFAERAPGEWIVVRATPLAGSTAPGAANKHQGH